VELGSVLSEEKCSGSAKNMSGIDKEAIINHIAIKKTISLHTYSQLSMPILLPHVLLNI
jgi:hypothetical protein